jgi:retron-type reverse transcriptase
VKRHGHLFDRLVSFENLLAAAQAARRGKRFKPNTARFDYHLERELLTLQHELATHTYRPGPYRTFTIREPKARLISAAPYRDRVVHHALCRVIAPIFERTFIKDSYACRVAKGTHLAVEVFQRHARRHSYVLKCDIAKYFPSIDHEILFNLLARKIKDARLLWLIRRIVDASNEQEFVCQYFAGDDLFGPLNRRKGIPIGNLTSQFFANVYLSSFDHFVKEALRCSAYLRYCDDFVVFGDDKRRLWAIKEAMAGYLARLRLTLHPRKCQVMPTREGVDFLGYRIFPTHRRLRVTTAKRCIRRLREKARHCLRGTLPAERFVQSLASWLGHAQHADTYGLRREVMGDLVELVSQRVPLGFALSGKGWAEQHSRPAGRVLEQQTAERAISEPEQQHADETERQQRLPVREDSATGDNRSARVSWAGAQESVRSGVYRPVPALEKASASSAE